MASQTRKNFHKNKKKTLPRPFCGCTLFSRLKKEISSGCKKHEFPSTHENSFQIYVLAYCFFELN